jgi:hypothetical protein
VELLGADPVKGTLNMTEDSTIGAHCALLRWLFLLLLALGPSPLLSSVQAQATEHQLKAAVLGNLAKFVEWPEARTNDSIVIGILGYDPFGNDLETVLKNIKVKGRGFTCVRTESIERLTNCHMVFVSSRETESLRELLPKIKKSSVLVVGEGARFLDLGGAVSLQLEDRKIQLSINPEAIDEAGLVVNPQLLRLAKTVKRKEQP